MPSNASELAPLLRLAVDAWPALETADVEGWLWRWSGGGSKRANSVSARTFRGADVDTAIAAVEQRYRARGAVPRFQLEADSVPAGLKAKLVARGYAHDEDTTTMVKAMTAGLAVPPSVEIADHPTPDWLAVYLSAITENRRVINRKILDRVPGPRAFCLDRRDGRPVSSGLSVAHGPNAIVECMATVAHARRGGGARKILAAIEAWASQRGATTLVLQAVADNAPAITLYESVGITHRARSRYMVAT